MCLLHTFPLYFVCKCFSIKWYKDGEGYPWTSIANTLPVLFSNNQSLVIGENDLSWHDSSHSLFFLNFLFTVNVTPESEGTYKCVASNGIEVFVFIFVYYSVYTTLVYFRLSNIKQSWELTRCLHFTIYQFGKMSPMMSQQQKVTQNSIGIGSYFYHSFLAGESAEFDCSAIVGPQYSSVKLQPVRAIWQNSQVSHDITCQANDM